MGTIRHEKLKELFLHEVHFAIKSVHGLNTSGIFTVTDVELSKDGKNLKIFFSVFGTEEDKKKSFQILLESKKLIRESFRKRLRLKVIPNLDFEFDTTPARASRIEDLFNKIHSEKINDTKCHLE